MAAFCISHHHHQRLSRGVLESPFPSRHAHYQRPNRMGPPFIWRLWTEGRGGQEMPRIWCRTVQILQKRGGPKSINLVDVIYGRPPIEEEQVSPVRPPSTVRQCSFVPPSFAPSEKNPLRNCRLRRRRRQHALNSVLFLSAVMGRLRNLSIRFCEFWVLEIDCVKLAM